MFNCVKKTLNTSLAQQPDHGAITCLAQQLYRFIDTIAAKGKIFY